MTAHGLHVEDVGRHRPDPIDPDSPKGREVAERLSKTCADIEIAIAARKARAEREATKT